MERQNNPKRRRARQRRKPKNFGYATGPNTNLVTSSGPSRFPKLPTSYCVSLTNTDYFQASAATAELFQILGMTEFLGYRPLYALELYSIYKYARIMRVDVEAQGVNIGANPIRIAIGYAAYNDVSGLTFDRFIEKAGTKVITISPQGGMDRGTLRGTFNTSQHVGAISDSKYWVDVTQSASSTPIDAKEPVIVMAIDNYQSSGTAFSAQINFKLTYHVNWFDLKTPASS